MNETTIDDYLKVTKNKKKTIERLYRELFAPIYRFIYSVVLNHEDAEDITSETFKKAMQKLDLFDFKKGNIKCWLFTIAKHILVDRKRKETKFRTTSVENEEIIAASSYNIDARDQQSRTEDESRNLLEKLNAIAPKYGQVIRLKYISGLSNNEIATMLNISNANVRQRLSRGIKILRILISRKD